MLFVVQPIIVTLVTNFSHVVSFHLGTV